MPFYLYEEGHLTFWATYPKTVIFTSSLKDVQNASASVETTFDSRYIAFRFSRTVVTYWHGEFVILEEASLWSKYFLTRCAVELDSEIYYLYYWIDNWDHAFYWKLIISPLVACLRGRFIFSLSLLCIPVFTRTVKLWSNNSDCLSFICEFSRLW